MKERYTRKDVKMFFTDVIKIPNSASVSNLFTYEDAIGYNAGVYGWNWDLYQVGTKAVITGYRNLVGRQADYKRINEYDEKARQIINDYTIPWGQKKALIDELITECFKEA